MKTLKIILGLSILFSLMLTACKKEPEPEPANNLPEGVTPFTSDDLAIVPYSANNLIFKNLPALDETLTLTFKEQITNEDYFAWQQTYFTYSTDADFELELRLRYLQSDNSQKTLAMYFPYRDNSGVLRENVFEIPVSPIGIESGFFQNIIEFHDTLEINSVEFYNVYETTELVSTDVEKDGPTNLAKVFYNATYGIIQMKERSGKVWMLQF